MTVWWSNEYEPNDLLANKSSKRESEKRNSTGKCSDQHDPTDGMRRQSRAMLLQVQRDLEQLFGTALLNGDIRMQRTRDHLTIVTTEGLLFDAGSHEVTPKGIDFLKQMGALFKAASLKEIRVAGHADRASVNDHRGEYFERLALSKARANSNGPCSGGEWSGFAEPYH